MTGGGKRLLQTVDSSNAEIFHEAISNKYKMLHFYLLAFFTIRTAPGGRFRSWDTLRMLDIVHQNQKTRRLAVVTKEVYDYLLTLETLNSSCQSRRKMPRVLEVPKLRKTAMWKARHVTQARTPSLRSPLEDIFRSASYGRKGSTTARNFPFSLLYSFSFLLLAAS